MRSSLPRILPVQVLSYQFSRPLETGTKKTFERPECQT